jgi:nicotinate-nucleotide adenylyltransferase
MKQIGIFGGTFDPIHLGHLMPAEYAVNYLRLEQLILIPSAAPVHRPEHQPAPGPDRVRMCELAAASLPAFAVSDIEIRRTEPSYTILTVRAMKKKFGPRARLTLLVGEDNLPTLHTWREVREILDLANVAIMPRPVPAAANLTALRTALGDRAVDEILSRRIPSPLVPISSTDIRARLRSGKTVRGLVPASVAEYIKSAGLYKAKRR